MFAEEIRFGVLLFSHDDEIVQPGYHRLFLDTYKIWVEQTVTDRVGLYRFTYTQDGLAKVLVNLGVI